MSAGPFSISGYTADDGKVFPIKHQPETALATLGANQNSAAAANTIGSGLPSVSTGKSRKSSGVHPRGVRLRFTGSVPAGYKQGGTTFIPVFSKTVYDAIPNKGGTGTYLEVPVAIVGKVPERIV